MSFPVMCFLLLLLCIFWKVSMYLSSGIIQLGVLFLLSAFQYPRAPTFNLFMCFFLISLCLLNVNFKSLLFSFSLLRQDRLAHTDQSQVFPFLMVNQALIVCQQIWIWLISFSCLLLEIKVMTNLDSILKSRDITLPIKFCVAKAMVFPVVIYRCESWTIKKHECQRTDVFEMWCWRRLLRFPWTVGK